MCVYLHTHKYGLGLGVTNGSGNIPIMGYNMVTMGSLLGYDVGPKSKVLVCGLWNLCQPLWGLGL